MNPPASSTTSGAEPEFGFFLKSVAVCLTALPLALHLWLPPGHPHLEKGSAVPVLYAVAMTFLYLRFATWIFFDGLWRRPSWFLPPFWMCIVPGIILAIFLEEKGTELLHQLVPGMAPAEPTIFDWMDEMRERFEPSAIPVAPRDPYAGIGYATVYFIAVVGFAEEFVKWLCSLTRRGGTQIERVALGFASGLGFGVAEAVHYAATFYNGQLGFLMYLARFVSIVGLHACWSSLTVYFMERRRKCPDRWANLHSVLLHLLPTVLLHGLYNVFVSYELNLAAMCMVAAALGLFLWMLWRMEHGIDWAGRSPGLVPNDPKEWIRTAWAACPPGLQNRIVQLADQARAAETPALPPAQAESLSEVGTQAVSPLTHALPAPSSALSEGLPAAIPAISTASADQAEARADIRSARSTRKRARPVKRCRAKAPRSHLAGRDLGSVLETSRSPESTEV
jgi:hypothetical protein